MTEEEYTQGILEGLYELIKEAKKQHKVIRCAHDNLIFTPSELEREIELGRFVWAAENFELVNPFVVASDTCNEVMKVHQVLVKFMERVNNEGW